MCLIVSHRLPILQQHQALQILDAIVQVIKRLKAQDNGRKLRSVDIDDP